MAGLDFEALMDASGILFGLYGLILTFLARDIHLWPKNLCVAILSSSVASAALSLLERAIAQDQSSPSLYRALYLIQTPIIPISTLLVFAYVLYCCGENPRRNTVMRIQCVLIMAMIVTCSLLLLTGKMIFMADYSFDPRNWSVLYLLYIAAYTAVYFVTLLRKWHKLTNLQRTLFTVYPFAPIAVKVLLVELLLASDLIQRYLAQQEESARQRTYIAVLQMRPHFIHNTLMTIYYLCTMDPEKAQRTILDFSRYLQNNFTAMVEEDTIPFEKELEHTRAYLAVEQALYKDRLFVEFDTPYTFFRIPPLTLQPIVENAVKHGLDPDLDPLYISVITMDTARGVQITIEDTGPGFSPTDDDEPHFALSNVRERLKTMCKGTLEIEVREAGGTKVTIFVPLEKTPSKPL